MKSIVLFSILSCFCGLVYKTNEPASLINKDTVQYETKFSYKEIFKSYYNELNENIAKDITLEAFEEGYYESGLGIREYTNSLVNEKTIAEKVIKTDITKSIPDLVEIKNGNNPVGQLVSPDEKYIIKHTDNPDITPASYFQRMPSYGKFNFSDDFDNGDIIVETKTKLMKNIGHSAYIYEPFKPYIRKDGKKDYYIQTIEAVTSGVIYGFLDDDRMIDFGVQIVTPTNKKQADMKKVNYFIRKQADENKPYDFPLTGGISTSIDANNWYCSEIIYAAYRYGGLNLGSPNLSSGWFMPRDFLNKNDCEFKFFDGFVEIKAYSYSYSGTHGYNVSVTNPSNSTIYFSYNKKLAFLDDAKKWKNLRDVAKDVELEAHQTKTVYIATNWYADAVAFSTIGGWNNKRRVTYAKVQTDCNFPVQKNIIN